MRERGDEKVRLQDLSLDKNCDREVQLRICAGRLFHAVGADIENETCILSLIYLLTLLLVSGNPAANAMLSFRAELIVAKRVDDVRCGS